MDAATPRKESDLERSRALDPAREPSVQLNLNVRGLKPSATLAIQARCERLRREGRTIHRLGLGQSPFPVPAPVVEALQANAHQKAYLPVAGLPELREAVANYHFRTQRLAASADDVLIGPGSKELMFLLQLVYYGDLMIPTPAWVSYAPQAHILGRQVTWLPTRREDNWRLTAAQFEAWCAEDPGRPRIVILNYPSNPTGDTLDAAELEALADVAARHRVILVSDEIYGELHYEGKHVSIARFYPEGTIISSGLSKWCGAGGWRLGTFLFPKPLTWLREALAAVASETFTSTSAPIQYAAIRAFQGGMRIERYLTDARRILAALGHACADRLRAAGVLVERPRGGFYLFPDFSPFAPRLRARGIVTSRQFCDALLDATGVAILPGSDFGRPRDEITARLAFVDFDGAKAIAAAERVVDGSTLDESFVRDHCGNVLDAMDAITRFLAE
jgi:aspartate aminotransferase